MDNIVLDDKVLSQYKSLESSIGSHAAAQAPVFPCNEVPQVKSGPKPEMWETHRSTIKRLYLDEGKTLKDVMAIMESDYGHKATSKMYKSRINKWGLDKKCKANEMKAVARKKVERDAIGKASSFRIRGRQVEIEEVLRYFKRKSYQSLEELVARDKSPEANTPSDVDCSTPGASIPSLSIDTYLGSSVSIAVAKAELIHCQIHSPQTPRSGRGETVSPVPGPDVLRSQLLWMNANLCRPSFFSRVPPSIEPPRDLLVPERLFSATKAFLQGSLNGNLWSTDEDGDLVCREPATRSTTGTYAIFDFYDSCFAAMDLLEKRKFVEARQLLSKACERSKNVTEEGHPETISLMLEIYYRFRHIGYGDAAITVFKHLRSSAVEMPSSPRAFHQFIENILLLDDKAEEMYSTSKKCIEDIFEQHLEPFSWPWIWSRLTYFNIVGSKSGSQEAERLLRSFSTKCEQFCGKSDARVWNNWIQLARHLNDQGKFEEAEEMGQDIVQYAKSSKVKDVIGYLTTRIIIEALELVSVAQYYQGKEDLAVNNLENCMDMAAQEYGENDPNTIHYSLQLEHILLGCGRQEEAMALAAQRKRILGSPVIWELLE